MTSKDLETIKQSCDDSRLHDTVQALCRVVYAMSQKKPSATQKKATEAFETIQRKK